MNAEKIRILFFIPNIICYFRLICLFMVIIFAFTHPVYVAIFVTLGAALDGVDGRVARLLKQESSLGMIADFVIDRIFLATFVLMLAFCYQKFWWIFCIILVLDMGGHFCQIYTTIFVGQKSHKLVRHAPGSLLDYYYSTSNRRFMDYCCVTHDLFLGVLYLCHFYPNVYFLLVMLLCLPGFMLKTCIHLMQIIHSAAVALHFDTQKTDLANF